VGNSVNNNCPGRGKFAIIIPKQFTVENYQLIIVIFISNPHFVVIVETMRTGLV